MEEWRPSERRRLPEFVEDRPEAGSCPDRTRDGHDLQARVAPQPSDAGEELNELITRTLTVDCHDDLVEVRILQEDLDRTDLERLKEEEVSDLERQHAMTIGLEQFRRRHDLIDNLPSDNGGGLVQVDVLL